MGQLDLSRRRLPRRRRNACDVCGRPAPTWELALGSVGGDGGIDRRMVERRCGRHFWRPGRSGTYDVSFR